MEALLEEMETIAASGTKLNLDYAIDEWLDEYDQAEILEYFKNDQNGNFLGFWDRLKTEMIKVFAIFIPIYLDLSVKELIFSQIKNLRL